MKVESSPSNHAITLRSILKNRKISYSDFGKMADLSRADISNIISGKRVVGNKLLQKIVTALGGVDGAKFAEIYFIDILPTDFACVVHVNVDDQAKKERGDPETEWALDTLANAMKVNEHLAKVIMNLARCHG